MVFRTPASRVLAALELREQLAFQVQTFGHLVFPLDVFQRVAVNDRLVVRASGTLPAPGRIAGIAARGNSPAGSKYFAASDRSAGEGEAGKCSRTSSVSPY